MVEGAGVVALGVFVGFSALVGAPDDLGRALALAAFALLSGAAMILVGIGLVRRRRWSRAPAIVTQFFSALVGVSMIQSGLSAIGAPLVVLAAVAVVLLLAPATSRAMLRN